MNRSLLVVLLAVAVSHAEDPVAIGSRRELFVDRLLIEKMEGTSLRMHAPQAAGVALKFDQPWEGRFSGYITVIHDEAAYLLQAAMIAHGHLFAPPPPLPEFFEQMHVFVTPVFAARYPPGFAIALVPGIWLGLPGLMPVLMSVTSHGPSLASATNASSSWFNRASMVGSVSRN